MKSLVILIALVGVAVAFEPVLLHYHQNVGIDEATRIKQAEQAIDFDGSRIIGGSAAKLGAQPHLGGLVITLSTGATSVCGSSLLTTTRSVTAAHCWWDGINQALQFVVVHGSTLLFSGGTRTTTSNVEMHENWNPDNLNNDVAVIVHNSVDLDNNIRLIPLATGNNSYEGFWGLAAGYGRTSDSVGIDDNQFISQVWLRVITNAVCQETYGNVAVVDSTLCTSGARVVGTCGGDSGGPLTWAGELIGIISFRSTQGCEAELPTGFARVTSFEAWIRARL